MSTPSPGMGSRSCTSKSLDSRNSTSRPIHEGKNQRRLYTTTCAVRGANYTSDILAGCPFQVRLQTIEVRDVCSRLACCNNCRTRWPYACARLAGLGKGNTQGFGNSQLPLVHTREPGIRSPQFRFFRYHLGCLTRSRARQRSFWQAIRRPEAKLSRTLDRPSPERR